MKSNNKYISPLSFLSFHPPQDSAGYELIVPLEEEIAPEVAEGHLHEASKSRKKREAPGRNFCKPKRAARLFTRKQPGVSSGSLPQGKISADLDANLEFIKKAFYYPENKDITIREFDIGLERPVRAAAVFTEGMVDKSIQNLTVFQPLMLLARMPRDMTESGLVDFIRRRLLPGNEVKAEKNLSNVIEGILAGFTAIFIDGSPKALMVETRSWEHRMIEQPVSERVVRGPHEAFSETLRANTGLIRKSIRNKDLVTEMIKLGSVTGTDVAVMYLKNIAHPRLVAEVKRRLTSLRTDLVVDSGMLEQFIEDQPRAVAPHILSTERPDRVVAAITDGKVAILVAGSPNVLIVPTTFWELLHTSEDYNIRPEAGNFIRILRAIGMLGTIFLSSIYISAVAFHHELIPTDLLLTIAANRERIPFPSVVEVLIMEIAFELIREAGIRVPGVVGPTLTIVGAIILGQAAVDAGLVNPIVVIVVPLTGITSFVIPNYGLFNTIRVHRFVFIFLGSIFGFVGVAIGIFTYFLLFTNIKSFGIPFFSMSGPMVNRGKDVFLRGPVWEQEKRPDYVHPRDRYRQPEISRKWTGEKQGPPEGQ